MKSFKRSETTLDTQPQRKGCLSCHRHTKLTVFLILPSFTVRFPIAFPSALDAGLVVSALELICTALYHTCKTPVTTVTSSHGTYNVHTKSNQPPPCNQKQQSLPGWPQKEEIEAGGVVVVGGGGGRWRRHQKKQKNWRSQMNFVEDRTAVQTKQHHTSYLFFFFCFVQQGCEFEKERQSNILHSAGSSSEESWQSLASSHFHRSGMHLLSDTHLKSVEPQVVDAGKQMTEKQKHSAQLTYKIKQIPTQL